MDQKEFVIQITACIPELYIKQFEEIPIGSRITFQDGPRTVAFVKDENIWQNFLPFAMSRMARMQHSKSREKDDLDWAAKQKEKV